MKIQLTKDEIKIAKIQKALSLDGWQWIETIYNDGHPENCGIVFSKDKSPHYLSNNKLGDMGWGRFSRLSAWKQAFEHLKNTKTLEL